MTKKNYIRTLGTIAESMFMQNPRLLLERQHGLPRFLQDPQVK